MTFGTCLLLVASVLATACGGSTTTLTEVSAAPDAVRCQTSFSAGPSSVPADGSRISVNVIAGRECSWTARSDASWAQVSPASGQGEAPITVTVSANPEARARSGAVVVNEARLSLTQEAAPCRYELSTTQLRMSQDGGRTSVRVSTPGGCAWRATSNAPGWARVATDSGTGAGTVEIDVSSNPGPARSTTISIQGTTLTLSQEARTTPTPTPDPDPGPNPSPNPTPPPGPTCSYDIDPSDRSFGASGGDGTVRVSTANQCSWNATAGEAWIDLSGSNGTGNDTIRYRVAANPSTSPRTGTISVRGRTHTVRQEGAPSGGGGGGGGSGEERIEISGRAFLVDGSCPNLSFLVNFRRVFTTGDTRFRGGCDNLRSGAEVSVEGRVQSDGRIRATEVRVRDDD